MKFELQVGFRLRVAGTDENSKGLTVRHEWDFADPESMKFPVLMRQLRYALLSIIRTASYATIFGWLPDEEFKARAASATQEECEQALALSRTADPPGDLEMGGPS